MTTTTRMPSLKALRAFTIAGRHQSFKHAADELCLSASAVSNQVRNLEAFFGFELFRRGTRSLSFTAAGRRYFEFLDGMFARLEMETHQLLLEYGRRMARLCVPPFFADELLLPRLDALHDLLPSTDVRVTTQTSLMKDHPAEADLSILLGDGEWDGLVTHRLFTRRLVVAAAPSLLRGFDRSSFEGLDDQTLIVHENRPNAWANWAKAQGIEVPRAAKVLRFDSMSTVVQATARGLGFAIVSWPLAENWFRSGALERVYETEWVTDEHFHLAYRAEDGERPEVRKIIDWLVGEFRRHA